LGGRGTGPFKGGLKIGLERGPPLGLGGNFKVGGFPGKKGVCQRGFGGKKGKRGKKFSRNFFPFNLEGFGEEETLWEPRGALGLGKGAFPIKRGKSPQKNPGENFPPGDFGPGKKFGAPRGNKRGPPFKRGPLTSLNLKGFWAPGFNTPG